MTPSEALLRAATMLKWFRNRAITVDTQPPADIGEIIVMLEQLAEHQRTIEMDDLELAELPLPTRPLDESPDA